MDNPMTTNLYPSSVTIVIPKVEPVEEEDNVGSETETEHGLLDASNVYQDAAGDMFPLATTKTKGDDTANYCVACLHERTDDQGSRSIPSKCTTGVAVEMTCNGHLYSKCISHDGMSCSGSVSSSESNHSYETYGKSAMNPNSKELNYESNILDKRDGDGTISEHKGGIISGDKMPSITCSQSGNTRTLSTCNICKLTFESKSAYLIHKRLHSGIQPFECEICHSYFLNRGILKTHMRVHTGEKPYKCTVCSAAFALKGNLVEHLRIHTGEKPFQCTQCQAAFAVSSNLRKHMRVHSGERPYHCLICPMKFTRRCHLQAHIRVHTREKPFKCQECTAAFSQPSDLKKHTRMHTGEKPYSCETCSASFSRIGGLQRHIRVHTGEKPYKCPVCGSTFADTSDLKRHRKKHHHLQAMNSYVRASWHKLYGDHP